MGLGATENGAGDDTARQRRERIEGVAIAAMLVAAIVAVLVLAGPKIAPLLGRLRANAPSMNAEKRDAEAVLRMKAQCWRDGAKMRMLWVQQYHGETFSTEPEYGYSEQLHTCLYSDSYSDLGAWFLRGVSTREDRFVVDVYANKVILELTLHDGRVLIPAPSDPVMCMSEREFGERKARLFGWHSRTP